MAERQEQNDGSSVELNEITSQMTLAELERLTDEVLILRFQAGDMHSFDLLVRRYKSPLLNYVYRFLGDEDEAADVLQDTFFRLYEKKHLYKTVAKFSTWIYTIAGNLARTELRKPQRRKRVSIGLDADDDHQELQSVADDDAVPDRIVDGRLKYERIQQALGQLPEAYREAVILRDVQDLSYEDIAEITDQPIGTVKSRINRGRAMLQNMLSDIYD